MVRSLILATAALVIAPVPAGATQTAPAMHESALDAALDALPGRFLAAQRSFDATALRAMTAPEFVEISPRGEVDPRDKMLGFYAPDKKQPGAPEMRFAPIATMRGTDAGAIVGRVTMDVATPAGPRHVEMIATYFARLAGSRWLLTSAQYTPVAPR